MDDFPLSIGPAPYLDLDAERVDLRGGGGGASGDLVDSSLRGILRALMLRRLIRKPLLQPRVVHTHKQRAS